MLRVVYNFECDWCHEVFMTSTYNVPTFDSLPTPVPQVVVNNWTLCEDCAKVAVRAAKEALENDR